MRKHAHRRPGWRRGLLALAVTAGTCLAPASGQGPAWAAAEPQVAAQMAAEALDAAARRLSEAESAKDRIAALTETIRAYEAGLAAMRDGLREATIRERVIRLRFEERRDQLARLLGVLQTIERAPAPLLLVHPAGPVGTARAGMLMSEVTPALQREAEELRTEIEELAALRELQTEAEEKLRLGLAGLQTARVALSQALADRTELPRRVADDPVRVQILADGATSLKAFAGSLGILPPPVQAVEPVPFEKLKGMLSLPVQGTVLRGFGETDAAGISRPGLTLAARPLALVTSPVAATVRYAGAFLDYGNVVILEPEADWLIVLAGLDEVYGEIGEIKDAGAPVGLLGGQEADAQEFLIEAGQGGGATGQETLYMELRYKGEPVDPTPWFALPEG